MKRKTQNQIPFQQPSASAILLAIEKNAIRTGIAALYIWFVFEPFSYYCVVVKLTFIHMTLGSGLC